MVQSAAVLVTGDLEFWVTVKISGNKAHLLWVLEMHDYNYNTLINKSTTDASSDTFSCL